MKTRAAVVHESPGEWSVEDVTLDDPGHGEILVRMVATGLCHSDDHIVPNCWARDTRPSVELGRWW